MSSPAITVTADQVVNTKYLQQLKAAHTRETFNQRITAIVLSILGLLAVAGAATLLCLGVLDANVLYYGPGIVLGAFSIASLILGVYAFKKSQGQFQEPALADIVEKLKSSELKVASLDDEIYLKLWAQLSQHDNTLVALLLKDARHKESRYVTYIPVHSHAAILRDLVVQKHIEPGQLNAQQFAGLMIQVEQKNDLKLLACLSQDINIKNFASSINTVEKVAIVLGNLNNLTNRDLEAGAAFVVFLANKLSQPFSEEHAKLLARFPKELALICQQHLGWINNLQSEPNSAEGLYKAHRNFYYYMTHENRDVFNSEIKRLNLDLQDTPEITELVEAFRLLKSGETSYQTWRDLLTFVPEEKFTAVIQLFDKSRTCPRDTKEAANNDAAKMQAIAMLADRLKLPGMFQQAIIIGDNGQQETVHPIICSPYVKAQILNYISDEKIRDLLIKDLAQQPDLASWESVKNSVDKAQILLDRLAENIEAAPMQIIDKFPGMDEKGRAYLLHHLLLNSTNNKGLVESLIKEKLSAIIPLVSESEAMQALAQDQEESWQAVLGQFFAPKTKGQTYEKADADFIRALLNEITCQDRAAEVIRMKFLQSLDNKQNNKQIASQIVKQIIDLVNILSDIDTQLPEVLVKAICAFRGSSVYTRIVKKINNKETKNQITQFQPQLANITMVDESDLVSVRSSGSSGHSRGQPDTSL